MTKRQARTKARQIIRLAKQTSKILEVEFDEQLLHFIAEDIYATYLRGVVEGVLSAPPAGPA